MLVSNVKILRLGIENLNGRVYTLDNTLPAVINLQNKIMRFGSVYGQIGFPEEDGISNVSLSYASHRIVSVRVQGDFVLAGIEILDTPCGRELMELVDNNGVVFRTRSIGNIRDKNIVDLIEIITIDAVPIDEDSYAGLMEDENDYND